MSDAYAFGQMAEKKAALYFKKKGFRVLAKNYRYRKAEIDLIVQKNDQLVAVEVKARSSKSFGAPCSFVSSKKINLMIMAMDAFVHLRKLDVDLRFDIMSYTLAGGKWHLEHLENAFYPF